MLFSLPGLEWHLGRVFSVRGEQVLVLVRVQGLHNLVAQDKGLHIQAEGLSPAQKHLEDAEKQISDGKLTLWRPH